MLDGLRARDDIIDRFPIETFETFRSRIVNAQKQRRIRRRHRDTALAVQAQKKLDLLNESARKDMWVWAGQTFLRRSWTETAFRERLVAFWADHFTARGKGSVFRRATSPYIEEAIRPFITERFSVLLQSAVMHPLMLNYLDQFQSMGPNSVRALKRGPNKSAGLNENLAREVLELHTLGVDGPYTQSDVRELAELFTGLSFQAKSGFKFRKDFVEPGTETILGRTYRDTGNPGAIRAVLDNLARHPATGRHIARKLAVHFVGDNPHASLIAQIESSYLDTEGDLMALYAALLDHPAAWAPELSNFKPPIDFVSSALRALAVEPGKLRGRSEKEIYRALMRPLLQMGQQWESPSGPDGWPEEDENWITPQGLAARVSWAMDLPEYLLDQLPDPRNFVETALGHYADDTVQFAAVAAETKSEAIGLVLMSPVFQRR